MTTLHPERERFLARVPEKMDGECWLWVGAHHRFDGYGQVKRRGKIIQAHRLSWELHNGPVPDGECVLHSCDTPACVNPAHLFTGTHIDNMADMAAKGRTHLPKGEGNGRAKLTTQDVIDIRASDESCRDLADRYGVRSAAISKVRTGERWGHVPFPDDGEDS